MYAEELKRGKVHHQLVRTERPKYHHCPHEAGLGPQGGVAQAAGGPTWSMAVALPPQLPLVPDHFYRLVPTCPAIL